MSAANDHRQPDLEKYASVVCVCGRKRGTYLRRLERVRCDCGQAWMCVQPRKGGDYILRPWFPFPWQWPGFEYLKPKPKTQ